MSLAPNMFDDLEPPWVSVIIHRLEKPEDMTRMVTLHISPRKGRSITVGYTADRYSPEYTILLAISHAIQNLEVVQEPLTRQIVEQALQEARSAYEAPF